MENNEIMDNDIMEENVTVVEDQESESYYPVTTENTDTDSTSGLGGLIKIAALGAGGFVLAKKFVWDRHIQPAIKKKRDKKKAEAEAEEERRFEEWAVKKGLLVPTEALVEETNGDVQDVAPEELTEEESKNK